MKSVLNIHWKDWCWSWISNTWAASWEELTRQKTLMLRKIEGRKKGMTEDEMAGWHHRLNGHEFEQAPGVGDGQGSLACCSPWGCKESDWTEHVEEETRSVVLWNEYAIFNMAGCFSLVLFVFPSWLPVSCLWV